MCNNTPPTTELTEAVADCSAGPGDDCGFYERVQAPQPGVSPFDELPDYVEGDYCPRCGRPMVVIAR